MAVSGGFGRAAGRISFDNKDLADIGIAAFTVGQFAVGVKGEFLLGQQVGTGLFLGLTDLGCFLCTGKHNLQGIQILVEITNDFFIDNAPITDRLASEVKVIGNFEKHTPTSQVIEYMHDKMNVNPDDNDMVFYSESKIRLFTGDYPEMMEKGDASSVEVNGIPLS